MNIQTVEVVADFTKSVNKESSLRLCRKIEKKQVLLCGEMVEGAVEGIENSVPFFAELFSELELD